jgi:hypothetical protein
MMWLKTTQNGHPDFNGTYILVRGTGGCRLQVGWNGIYIYLCRESVSWAVSDSGFLAPGSEARGRRSEARGRRSEARGRRSEARGRRSEARGRRSEARGRRSEARVGGDLRPGGGDLRPGGGDLRPGDGDLRPGGGDLRSQEPCVSMCFERRWGLQPPPERLVYIYIYIYIYGGYLFYTT